MHSKTNIHWLAPVTMLAALISGILLAVGHHIYFASLSHNAVTDGSYSFSRMTMSEQQFNITVGTALALLARVCLSVAVTVAYTQVFWRSMRHSNRQPSLAELDWAASGLDNVFQLFNFKRGWRWPSLVLLALVFWCIPVATIFPPAALTVIKARVEPYTEMLEVPQLDFTTFNFAAALPLSSLTIGAHPERTRYSYMGPSQPVQNIAMATAGLGQILPLAQAQTNATWKLEFPGPRMQCSNVDVAARDNIWKNIWTGYTQGDHSAYDSVGPYTYLAWVPWSEGKSALPYSFGSQAIDRSLPFMFNITKHSDGNRVAVAGPSPSSLNINGSASLYIAVLPAVKDYEMSLFRSPDSHLGSRLGYTPKLAFSLPAPPYNKVACGGRNINQTISSLEDPLCTVGTSNYTFRPASVFSNSTLIKCDLVNSTYSAQFSYTESEQEIRIGSDETENPQKLRTSPYFFGPFGGGPIAPIFSKCTYFSAGSMEEPWDKENPPCQFRAEDLRLLSYQSISSAFNELVVGSIRWVGRNALETNTLILKTILSRTEDFASLRNPETLQHKSLEYLNMQDAINLDSNWSHPEVVNSKLPITRGDLKSTIEQLFENMTISLLTEPYLQANYSSPFAPARLVNVTLWRYHNIYKYDHQLLWITYGLSIAGTLLAVAGGLLALISNQVSYSDDFSTTFRISQAARLNVDITNDDGLGHDPLPQHLKYAKVKWNQTTLASIAIKKAESGTSAESENMVFEQMSLVEERRKVDNPSRNLPLSEPVDD